MTDRLDILGLPSLARDAPFGEYLQVLFNGHQGGQVQVPSVLLLEGLFQHVI